jgi:hypothetical protein
VGLIPQWTAFPPPLHKIRGGDKCFLDEGNLMNNDYIWIIKILNELTVTKQQFNWLVENYKPKEVDKILTGKIVDIEKDKLIESLLK